MGEEYDELEHLEPLVENFIEQTGLSPTRGRVLALLKLNKEKEEIADILNVSERTVQNHIQDIRKEISAAEELVDMVGRTHYDDSTLYREFGGNLWNFASGCRYEKNEDTTVELKLYSSPHGACLLIERTITESQGSITEERKRTEFYNGNDIPPYLFRSRKYDSYKLATLHTAFIANAGIDPKYSPAELVAEDVSVDATQMDVQEVVDNNGKWLTID